MNFHAAYLFSYTAAFYCYEWEVLLKILLWILSFWLDHDYADKFINKILYKLREFLSAEKIILVSWYLLSLGTQRWKQEGPFAKVFLSKL